MKRVLILMATACAVFPASQALAQANPFVPPAGNGLTRAQIEQIVRQEVDRTHPSGKSGELPGGPDGIAGQMRGGPNVAGLPSQKGGKPLANTAAGGAGAATPDTSDPVADLLKDGGVFVGCVADTPIFKDKLNRRAYFTTKELRESNAARRYTRCN